MNLFDRSRTARRRSWRLLAAAPLAALLALTVAACGGGMRRPPAGTPDPDKFLFEQGTENLDRRRWLVAREFFRELIDTYPQSRYRADAKLGVGDTYIGEGSAESYVLALNEFREFLAYYPTHPRVDYAYYIKGLSSLAQSRGFFGNFLPADNTSRDPGAARESFATFAELLTRFPESPYAADTRKGEDLAQRVQQSAAEGVLFCAPSFCDPALLDQPMSVAAIERHGIPWTAFKYAENGGQFQVIREQAGTFADSIKLWSEV